MSEFSPPINSRQSASYSPISPRSARRSKSGRTRRTPSPRRKRSAASARKAVHHPRAEMSSCAAGRSSGSLAAEDRGREVELEFQLAIEGLRDLALERAVGIEPRDFIFVLVGHQFERVAGDRERESAAPGRLGRLRLGDGIDESAIPRRIGGVLIGGQEFHPARDHGGEIGRLFGRRRRQREGRHARGIGARGAAPIERGEVHRHRLAVEFDGAADRGAGQTARSRSDRRSRA